MRVIVRQAAHGVVVGLGLAATTALAQTADPAAPPPVPTLPAAPSPVATATLGLTDPGGLSLGGAPGLAGTRFGIGTVTTGGLTNPGGLSFGGGSVGSIGGPASTPGARGGALEPEADTPGGGAPGGAGIAGAPSRADAFFDPFEGRTAP